MNFIIDNSRVMQPARIMHKICRRIQETNQLVSNDLYYIDDLLWLCRDDIDLVAFLSTKAYYVNPFGYANVSKENMSAELLSRI